MEMTVPKKRRSIKLSSQEMQVLKKLRRNFGSDIEMAEAIGISRQVLALVMAKGSGSQDTVARIRDFII